MHGVERSLTYVLNYFHPRVHFLRWLHGKLELIELYYNAGYTSPREYGGYLPAMPVMEVTPTSVSTYREEVKAGATIYMYYGI